MTGPVCYCCGKAVSEVGYLQCAQRGEGWQVWVCEKHVGRTPCCVPGCGRTFKLLANEDYTCEYLCGRHWRSAPKYMRLAVARVRRIGNKTDWPENVCRRYTRLWLRCKRAILDGKIDLGEIETIIGS